MGGRRSAAACVGAAALVLLAGCMPPASTSAPLPTDGSFVGVSDADWQDGAMADASIRLGATMVSLGAGQDIVVSPASLQLLMSVLREGSTGSTETQLNDVLGLPEEGSQAVADLRALLAEYDGDVAAITAEQPPESPVLHVAEALFVQPDGPVQQEFLARAASFHRAEVVETDFLSGTGKAALDGWVAEQTGGLVAAAPVEPPEGTRLVLLDAALFGATWLHPFPVEGTADRPFTVPDGTQVPVRTMSQNLSTAYVAGEGWQAVELPYTEGFVMRLALTDNGRSPDWSSVAGALSDAPETSVHVELPSWRTDTAVGLMPTLQGLGVRAITRPGHLERLYDGAVVTDVAQVVSITVGEAGTADGAAAVAGEAAPDPTATMLFNRAFDYQVVHDATGLVLFAGRLVDPR